MNAQLVLEYAERLANNNLAVNLSMHLVILAALIAVFLIKEGNLRRILYQVCICVPLVSVTLHAFIFGNPFHAITFSILAIAALSQLVLNKGDIKPGSNKLRTTMAFLGIFIGLWYPEFVHKNIISLFILSPVGILPCPTLLATLGLMTLVYPGSGKLQYGITVFMGLVYGIIGTFVLKVYLDITLLLMAVYALYIYLNTKPNKCIDKICTDDSTCNGFLV